MDKTQHPIFRDHTVLDLAVKAKPHLSYAYIQEVKRGTSPVTAKFRATMAKALRKPEAELFLD